MSNLETLNKHNFRFNKAYGQNFIFDTNFLESIANGIVDENTTVLEIGTGAGTLTKILGKHAKRVVSYEIDNNLQPILKETLTDSPNVQVIFQDIMKANMADIEQNLGTEYIMVANLPYYITTPIIFKFLEEATRLKSMTIMVQLEVAERLVAKAGSKDYGAITPAIDYRANAKIVKRVNRNMFTPAPNVDSAIVNIEFVKNKYNIKDTKILDQTIRSAFAMRRKTLENNLKSTFGFNAEQISQILIKAGIKEKTRGETLDTQKLVDLSNAIYEYMKK